MILNTAVILGTLRLLFNQTLVVDPAIDAYLIPAGDEHKSEYVSACHDRRSFISGFDGSAGVAVVTTTEALLWTDSRYWVQAEQQLDKELWTLMKQGDIGVLGTNAWLAQAPNVNTVGADPALLSKSEWDALASELRQKGKSLVQSKTNLVDLVWANNGRPACSNESIFELEERFHGRNTSLKLADLRSQMNATGVGILVVSDLDEVAWLLNMRGGDISYSPLFFGYVIVRMDGFDVFVEKTKLSNTIEAKLNGIGGTVHEYNLVGETLVDLARNISGSIWFSRNANSYLVNMVIATSADPSRVITRLTPIALMKAMKNDVEVMGMVNAHIRDGAAVVEYLSWLEKRMETDTNWTEITAANVLEEFRKTKENFYSLSFDTISASGPNAALPHYSPRPESDRPLSKDEIYLVDSGGQYFDGTTDITRTVYFGEPSDAIKNAFTRVLKGNIAMRTQVFPRKAVGSSLDSLARKSLWDDLLNFGHGTGHGIGSFLGVHEGPFSIGSRTASDDPGLDENMFMSDEPGYYKDGVGGFGIRIENILRTVNATADKTFLKFEDVTLCPIQMKLVMPELLNSEEVAFLDDYHKRVRDTLTAYMTTANSSKEAIDWLARNTITLNQYTNSATSLFPTLGLIMAVLVAVRNAL